MHRTYDKAFTLLELLVSVGIITMLTGLVAPSLQAARELGRSARCLANLHNMGVAMGSYQAVNRGYFWPYSLPNWPASGVRCYFWGTDADPVDTRPSPFMQHAGPLSALWCPSFRWGSYVPQGSYVSEPTTTYGYNGGYLDRKLNGTSCRHAATIPQASDLFVMGDTAMAWKPGKALVFQNSTYLEPITGAKVQMPTNHFRHLGKTNVLCADGRAASFGTEGWVLDSPYDLGFVGTQNYPHYRQ